MTDKHLSKMRPTPARTWILNNTIIIHKWAAIRLPHDSQPGQERVSSTKEHDYLHEKANVGQFPYWTMSLSSVLAYPDISLPSVLAYPDISLPSVLAYPDNFPPISFSIPLHYPFISFSILRQFPSHQFKHTQTLPFHQF